MMNDDCDKQFVKFSSYMDHLRRIRSQLTVSQDKIHGMDLSANKKGERVFFQHP